MLPSVWVVRSISKTYEERVQGMCLQELLAEQAALKDEMVRFPGDVVRRQKLVIVNNRLQAA